jgi:hypothetical protein
MNVNEVIANRAIELLGGGVVGEAAGPPQRRREPRAVVERRVPDRDARRRRRRRRARLVLPALRRLRDTLGEKSRASPTSSRSAAPTCRTPTR